jgi:glutamate dehydrogenase/leucine dehydrogenase
VGLGKVGGSLARKVAARGARVVAFDVDGQRMATLADEGVIEPLDSVERVVTRDLDVLAPCAAGGLVDEQLAAALDCRVICGAANNPLSSSAVAEQLASREILYVPDFLANCGGLINVAAEWSRGDDDDVESHIAVAMRRLDDALEEAARTGRPPAAVAEQHALERVARARAAASGRPLVAAA